MARFNNSAPPRLEFEAGHLVKVNGARPEHMDGYSLLSLARYLGSKLAPPASVAVSEARLSAQIERLESNLMASARGAFYAGYSEGISLGIAVCSGGDDSLDIEASWENSLSRQIARMAIADAKRARP